uniref:Putative secreted protein n=1 Tax=Ixodes ricinus TaxID=34613 RepID=A0A6B0TRY7_IXORI
MLVSKNTMSSFLKFIFLWTQCSNNPNVNVGSRVSNLNSFSVLSKRDSSSSVVSFTPVRTNLIFGHCDSRK